VYLKGLEPSELLDNDSRHVTFMQELPFQEGKPLSPISEEGEGSTELPEYSHTADNSSDRQVNMASLRNADDDEQVPSTTMNYSQTCLPMSVRWTPPRMRMRSTKGSGG
jgi:hypothetical protein